MMTYFQEFLTDPHAGWVGFAEPATDSAMETQT